MKTAGATVYERIGMTDSNGGSRSESFSRGFTYQYNVSCKNSLEVTVN